MPLDILPAQSGNLATTAYCSLTASFAGYEPKPHRPSQEQLDAIRDLLEHLELAAEGCLEHAMHLSPIPAGTGKSTALAHFAATLLDSPAHTAVGMIIFVNRIEEAKAMAGAILQIGGTRGQRYASKLCVITSDERVNELGNHQKADEAQLVVATQAALKRTLRQTRGRDFNAATRFLYLDERRAVVCWDEALAFNRPVVLDSDNVGRLADAMRKQSGPAATALKHWAADIDDVTGLYDVPDFEAMGVNFSRLEEEVDSQDDLVVQAKALAVISGSQGFVSRRGFSAAIVVHYPEIPRSILPVIATDASARVNRRYKHMAKKVPVIWLKEARKTYRNLKIRLVTVAASRNVYADKKSTRGRDLLDIVKAYVSTVPQEAEILVIGYKLPKGVKGVPGRTLEEALMAHLPDDEKQLPNGKRRVHYLTYGNHTASNEFKHIKHVLLLGLNFLPWNVGHATAGAALKMNLRDQHPSDEEIAETNHGMLMDSTLQAILRGNARMGEDGDCGACEVVILQSKQAGLSDDDYRFIFPRCNLIQDPVLMPQRELKGRLKELAVIVTRRLEAGDRELTNQSLCGEMAMDKANFLALVRKPEWQSWIAAAGLHPALLSGGRSGLKAVA
jgi:hypothetical protein